MSNGFETCDQHTYLFATEGKDCPYCEISRLKAELEEAKSIINDLTGRHGMQTGDMSGNSFEWRTKYTIIERQLDEANDKYNRCNEARSYAVKEAVNNKDMWDGSARRVKLLEAQLAEARAKNESQHTIQQLETMNKTLMELLAKGVFMQPAPPIMVADAMAHRIGWEQAKRDAVALADDHDIEGISDDMIPSSIGRAIVAMEYKEPTNG